MCALNEPQTSRKSARDGNGTTGAISAQTKPILHSLPPFQSSCHSSAKKSACSCGWGAKPFAPAHATAHRGACSIRRCARRAPSSIAVAESFHAPARVREAMRVMLHGVASVRCAKLPHRGWVVREVPSYAADFPEGCCRSRAPSSASMLRSAPIRCASRFQSASSPPAASPGPLSTRSCCCRVGSTVTHSEMKNSLFCVQPPSKKIFLATLRCFSVQFSFAFFCKRAGPGSSHAPSFNSSYSCLAAHFFQ